MSLRTLYDVPAPAKLNLFLHIIGRRDDGYHLLQSVFVLIDWSDSLHFEVRDDRRLSRHDLGATLPDDDLCLRAARALQSASGSELGADISIDKVVPWGAGLGGGSSDAASTLLALNRLWGLNWPRASLTALGLKLGADVPFFIGGRNAFVEGVGERLTPLPVPPHWLAVLKPNAGIATQALFASPLLVRNTDAVILEGFLVNVSESVGQVLLGSGRNDMQSAAEACCPEVAQAASLLQARFGNCRMTGSGSAVFARAGALVDNAIGPMATMPSELPAGWVGRMCRSLESHPLAGWVRD